MGKLMYIATTSVDGFVADDKGNFDWGAPDAERHQFINDVVRRAGTMVMGRRMYDTMVVWEDREIVADGSAVMADFRGIWLAAEKVVFSRSLQAARSEKTQVISEFDPQVLSDMKGGASADLTIGGPEIAMEALRAGLVDEVHLFVVPVLLGSGNRAFKDGVGAKLQLSAQRGFDDGTLYSAYTVGP